MTASHYIFDPYHTSSKCKSTSEHASIKCWIVFIDSVHNNQVPSGSPNIVMQPTLETQHVLLSKLWQPRHSLLCLLPLHKLGGPEASWHTSTLHVHLD